MEVGVSQADVVAVHKWHLWTGVTRGHRRHGGSGGDVEPVKGAEEPSTSSISLGFGGEL